MVVVMIVAPEGYTEIRSAVRGAIAQAAPTVRVEQGMALGINDIREVELHTVDNLEYQEMQNIMPVLEEAVRPLCCTVGIFLDSEVV